jgi:hypothetical protein
MKHVWKLLTVCAGLLLAGCATVPAPKEAIVLSPEETVAIHAEAAREAKGVVAVGQGSSLTLPMAQDKTLRRVRQDAADALDARVAQLQVNFLASAGIADVEPVVAWFEGVSTYLRGLLPGVPPALETTQIDDGLVTHRVLLVVDPGMIVQALEVRGVANRQLYELIRASQAYRTLLAEAETFGQYRVAQDAPLF